MSLFKKNNDRKISETEGQEVDLEMDKANELMEEGANQEAKEIIERMLLKYPLNENIYFQAGCIYNWGEMYPEIIELFDRYKKNTGKEMGLDISVVSREEVEKRQKEYLAKNNFIADQGGKRRFKRLQWLFYLIEWVEVDNEGIRFKKIGSEPRFYKWLDVQAVLRRIDVSRGRLTGPAGRGLIIQASDGKKYKMQISPADKQSVDFLTEIRKHIKIKHGPAKTETILLGIPTAIIFMFAVIKAGSAGSDSAALFYILVIIITLTLYSLISSRF